MAAFLICSRGQLHAVAPVLHAPGKLTVLQCRTFARHSLSHSANGITEPLNSSRKGSALGGHSRVQKAVALLQGLIWPHSHTSFLSTIGGHLGCIAGCKDLTVVMQPTCCRLRRTCSRRRMHSRGPRGAAGPGRATLPQAQPAEGCHACRPAAQHCHPDWVCEAKGEAAGAPLLRLHVCIGCCVQKSARAIASAQQPDDVQSLTWQGCGSLFWARFCCWVVHLVHQIVLCAGTCKQPTTAWHFPGLHEHIVQQSETKGQCATGGPAVSSVHIHAHITSAT